MSQPQTFTNIKKQFSYDKLSETLLIGELPGPDHKYTNPVKMKLHESEYEDNGILVTLTNISCAINDKKNVTYINLDNVDAKLGLIHIIVAPHFQTEYLNNNYINVIMEKNGKMEEKQNPKKFFSDIYISKKMKI